MKLERGIAIVGVVIILCLVAFRLMPALESQWSVLETSTEFTLYSTRPLDSGTNTAPVSGERFSSRKAIKGVIGYPVYGKVTITDPIVKAELINALKQGAKESVGITCTDEGPSHGIRAVKGQRVIDVSINFDCQAIHLEENGKSKRVLITKTPRQIFDRVLRDANIPLQGPRGPY